MAKVKRKGVLDQRVKHKTRKVAGRVKAKAPAMKVASESFVLSPYMSTRSPKQAYDLISAVRGPDYGYNWSNVKAETTARIRHIVFGDDYPMVGAGSITTHRADTKSVRELAERCRSISTSEAAAAGGWHHFTHHLKFAITASLDHPVWGGLAYQIISALAGRS